MPTSDAELKTSILSVYKDSKNMNISERTGRYIIGYIFALIAIGMTIGAFYTPQLKLPAAFCGGGAIFWLSLCWASGGIMTKGLKAWLKERRIKRFRARLKETYPDADRLFSKLAWLDGTNQFFLDGVLVVDDVVAYHVPSEEEQKAIDEWLGID